MDLKEIKRLITIVEEAQISHFSIEEDGIKIEVKKELTGGMSVTLPQQVVAQQLMPQPVQSVQPAAAAASAPKEDVVEGTAVKSQMVGTFYITPSPESPPFVKVGERVEKGQVLCIIEAMKLFNEIESDVAGVVEKICVSNASPVEFGQSLFIIREG